MHFDAVIVGGGPAGSSLAIVLAACGWRLARVDDARHHDFKPGEGLVPAARRMLSELGVWEAFLDQGHLPSYGNESVWGQSQPQGTDFIQSIDGNGWRLDRLGFDGLLRQRCSELGVVEIKDFAERVGGQPGAWQVELRGGDALSCGWLIDASGRSARFARQLGAARTELDQLLAFHLHFAPEKPGDRYASSLIEAVPEGWWYNALLPDGHRVLYFFTDAGSPAQKLAPSTEGFLSLLSRASFVRRKLDQYAYHPVGTPSAADARSARLDRFCGDNWLAVGDAALSFDPLSSQGIFTALYGGIMAGKALLERDEGALDRYHAAMVEVWQSYLRHRGSYYQAERRWPDAPFWAGRH